MIDSSPRGYDKKKGVLTGHGASGKGVTRRGMVWNEEMVIGSMSPASEGLTNVSHD